MAAEPAGAAGPKEDAFDQFPAPPNFYKLYEAGPGAGPAPPAPVQGVIHALGEAFDPDEQYVAPLPVSRMYQIQQDGSVDIRAELLRLNRGLLFMFLELLQVLVDQPSQYSGSLSEILGVLFNMAHLLNMARPLQARETLKHALRTQIAEKQAALAALRSQSAKVRQELLAVTQQLAAVGGDAAESAQRPAAQQQQQQQQQPAAAMNEG
ncbi:hypothetical protein OEZ86_000317 [Tetradesmus obliquus]|nr:hypothetical protein OEZ86_000317 [Tetradesmus obliquus]